MNTPIDVLAVMDCAAETLVRMKGAEANARLVNVQRDALTEARAAVAELIEACEGVETLYAELGKALPALAGTPSYDVVQEAVCKARAALARVQGGSA